jgi:hypothetical protein
MSSDNERGALLAEKAQLEASLGEIRQKKNAKELEVLRQRLDSRDEFKIRRQIELEARQAGAPARERVAEIVARLQELKPQSPEYTQAEILRSVLETLREIRDELQKSRSESWANGSMQQQS